MLRNLSLSSVMKMHIYSRKVCILYVTVSIYLQEKLSTTELTAEKLVQQLEDMEAEHKRARTVRYEFQVRGRIA